MLYVWNITPVISLPILMPCRIIQFCYLISFLISNTSKLVWPLNKNLFKVKCWFNKKYACRLLSIEPTFKIKEKENFRNGSRTIFIMKRHKSWQLWWYWKKFHSSGIKPNISLNVLSCSQVKDNRKCKIKVFLVLLVWW